MTDFRVVIDDREKLPYRFRELPTTVARLETGDYTVDGFEDVFAIERKSIPDLVQSVTHGRKNFEAEILRAQSLSEWAIVIEGTPEDVTAFINDAKRLYGAKVHPNQVLGTVRSWNQYKGANFIWAGSRNDAKCLVYDSLFKWYLQYADLQL